MSPVLAALLAERYAPPPRDTTTVQAARRRVLTTLPAPGYGMRRRTPDGAR